MVRFVYLALISAFASSALGQSTSPTLKGSAIDSPLVKSSKKTGRGVTRRGVAVFTIDTKTGRVKRVQILETTGNKSVDQSVVRAYRKWRFAPGTQSTVNVPIILPTMRSRGENYAAEVVPRP